MPLLVILCGLRVISNDFRRLVLLGLTVPGLRRSNYRGRRACAMAFPATLHVVPVTRCTLASLYATLFGGRGNPPNDLPTDRDDPLSCVMFVFAIVMTSGCLTRHSLPFSVDHIVGDIFCDFMTCDVRYGVLILLFA